MRLHISIPSAISFAGLINWCIRRRIKRQQVRHRVMLSNGKKGRSKIAEAICPEWIDITTQKIPAAYWRALREGKLRDERTWNAIQTFSKNCERRFSAEKAIREEFSMSDHQAVILPSRLDARDKSHKP